MSQLPILSDLLYSPPYNPSNPALNFLLIPAYISLASILVALLHALSSTYFYQRFIARPLFGIEDDLDSSPQHVIHSAGIIAECREHIKYHGGFTIYTWKSLRFLGSLGLLALTITLLVLGNNRLASTASVTEFMHAVLKKKKHKNPSDRPDQSGLTPAEWYQISLCAVFLYTSLLSLMTLLSPLKRARIASAHVAVVLFSVFCVYAYRDLWPLCTFSLTPADASEGPFLWARLSLVSFVGLVVPLLIPRQYIPVDPKKPQTEINTEQTCSLLSFLLFTFLDPIIFDAYRKPHLPFDDLPPLCDYDRTEQLIKRSFKLLDPYVQKNPRYMFWNLMRVFWKEYSQLFILITVKVLAGFLAPLTIKQLLFYVEAKGIGALVQPWVWILLMFLGPVVGSIAFQWYIWITTGTLVRVEGIITQLVFEHSLRIRMVEKLKAGNANSSKTTTDTSNTNASNSRSSTPTPESVDADGTVESSIESDTTLQASSIAVGTASDGKKQAAAIGAVAPAPPSPTATATTPSTSTNDDDDQAANLTGRINNLITVDTNNIIEARDFLFLIWYGPLELVICCWFLFNILEWSAVVGIATIIICFPLPGYCAKLVNSVQKERMKKTDARTQNVTEVLNVLRMIKLFAWEKKIQEQMDEKREDELKYIKKRQILQLINWTLNYLIPIFALLTTFSSYTLIWKNELTASRVFSSMAVFDMLRDQLHMIFYFVPQIIQGKVSLDRVDKFLRHSELLDEFKSSGPSLVNDIAQSNETSNEDEIGFQDATFSWSDEEEQQSGALTPSRRSFRLRIEGDLFFKRGQINLIIGPTGCGKTSLLYALLGEMHFIPTEPRSWFNLPRTGGVAYAAQESWVQNETIKDNILFGSPMDEERYKKVLYQCGLEQDLALFDAGDSTEVGEKGLTLSGGQKARITLARAIYSKAKILLLDDVLAALDVHTAKWIVDKCFQGDLVTGRTVILVTHNVTLASPVADYVVSLGLDGRILSRGSMSDALKHNSKLLDKAIADEEVVEKSKEGIDTAGDKDAKAAAGKLIVAEEIALGHVRWPALKLYFVSLGGWFFWTVVLTGDFAACVIGTMQTWYLGYWAAQYDLPGEVNVAKYVTGYSILLLAGCVAWFAAFLTFFLGTIRASRTIYHSLTEAVLGTTLRWLDTTPTSRVIARCTQDIRAVDGPIAGQLADIIDIMTFMVCRLAAVVIVTPLFLVPGLIVGGVGGYCGQIYIAAQLSVKREMSNARSPVLGHFGAAIAGLTSLRAYGAQAAFRNESMVRVDKYIRAGRTFYSLNRWISIRVDTLGSLFAAALAAYLVYSRKESGASTIGFSLNMAVAFSGVILWLVRIYNEFEVQGNSLERIQDYIEIEQEPKPTEDRKPPAYWPASGDIRVESLSARYSSDGPKVLHDLSFEIRSGERIGVVGRTGSGKSSLTLSLLRCIFTSGDVYYDGVNTANINLEALRSNITIIPQQPELLAGTLRENLDPFGQHEDAILNDALRSAGLFSLQDEKDDARIGLDSPIASGGSNLSVGQRQILALARAIIRGSKLLILDEATSAIDYDTDAIIQSSIRRELKDVTLITVAHRLQTIMDADRIMVLNSGKLEEYDTPKNLLQKPEGLLRSLVDESGDRDKLYAMAEGTSTSSND